MYYFVNGMCECTIECEGVVYRCQGTVQKHGPVHFNTSGDIRWI